MIARERIDIILNELRVKAPTFAKNINVSYSRIYDIQREKTSEISGEVANAIVRKYPQFNINWLLTGEGKMLISDKSKPEIQVKTKSLLPFIFIYTVKDFFNDYYSYLNYKEISPMLQDKQLSDLTNDESAEIAEMVGLNHNNFVSSAQIVSTFMRTGKLVPIYNAETGNGIENLPGTREGWTNVGDLLADSEGSLYMYGNSMIPGYPPGSLVGVKYLNESFIEPGSVYMVETESNRYIKRLYYNENKTSLVCMSDNHMKHTDGPMEGQYFYPPFEIPLSVVKRIYKVVGVIRRNTIKSR